MKKLVLSTDNKNKLNEIKELCKDLDVEILSKSDVNLKSLEVEENKDTLEANAKLKVEAIANRVNYNVIGDDTGLFIDELNGAPGVYSARFAGEHDDVANRKKVLELLKDKKNRNAHFKTVIVLIDENKKEHIFEGVCNGIITEEERGDNGFGYDKIFKPNNSNKTFGEMDLAEKNNYSHRAKALEKFISYLKKF